MTPQLLVGGLPFVGSVQFPLDEKEPVPLLVNDTVPAGDAPKPSTVAVHVVVAPPATELGTHATDVELARLTRTAATCVTVEVVVPCPLPLRLVRTTFAS